MLLQGTDNIQVILLQSTGLPTDTTLVNYPNLGAMLAVAAEANFTNYARINLSSSAISITYNTVSTPTKVTVGFANQTWNSAGGALNNTIAKVVLSYQQTSSTPDSGCLVLGTLDYSGSTTGGALNVTLGTLSDA